LIVNHLTEHGVMEAGLLYESPFTDLTPRGPEGTLQLGRKLSQLMAVLDRVRTAGDCRLSAGLAGSIEFHGPRHARRAFGEGRSGRAGG